MSGLPLNFQLTNLGASFIRACKTAPAYKMYSLGKRGPIYYADKLVRHCTKWIWMHRFCHYSRGLKFEV